MKLMLKVFFSLHELKDKHFHVTQHAELFPPDVTPEAAYAELQKKHGHIKSGMWDGELRTPIASSKYAIITHHTMVDADREQVVLPADKVTEQALPGIDFKACLQDSPKMAAKRNKKHRNVNR